MEGVEFRCKRDIGSEAGEYWCRVDNGEEAVEFGRRGWMYPKKVAQNAVDSRKTDYGYAVIIALVIQKILKPMTHLCWETLKIVDLKMRGYFSGAVLICYVHLFSLPHLPQGSLTLSMPWRSDPVPLSLCVSIFV